VTVPLPALAPVDVVLDGVVAVGCVAGVVDCGESACAKASPQASANTIIHNANFSMEVPPAWHISNLHALARTL
jgi:hypothetical protein